MKQMMNFCSKHGLPINPAKIEFSEAIEGIKILGVMVKNGQLTLPREKEMKILEMIDAICGRGIATKRQMYELLGKLNFFRALGQGLAGTIQPVYEFLKTFEKWDQMRNINESVIRILRQIQSEIPSWTTHTIVGDCVDIQIDSSAKGVGVACYDSYCEGQGVQKLWRC